MSEQSTTIFIGHMMPSIKFAEAKLRPDLINWLDWSTYMTTYLKYHGIWDIVEKTDASDTNDVKNIKAYTHLESQCEVETRRSYLRGAQGKAATAWTAL